MDRKRSFLLIVLLALGGCQAETEQAARPAPPAPEPAAAVQEAPPAGPPFAGKVWVSTTSPDLPGVMRIFLADGTLVMDSCWETYRLARWRMASDHELVWEEDSQEIRADVESSGEELALRLHLVDGTTREERYRPASVPFVCPDMKR
ncbi:MAG TPA: hypothetical protein VEL74_06990 [Thermoanaerobaculia bacterium]|nr:hypothetical protein [Thermoanaerobaculia bacterium]